jgi:purine nucleoside phosphorylase
LAVREVVAACTLGPSLETPAERRLLARAGAEVSAQGLAPTLIASAHAGLGGLTIVVVTHEGEAELDIAKSAARSDALAPALDDLLVQLSEEVQRRARARLEEESA